MRGAILTVAAGLAASACVDTDLTGVDQVEVIRLVDVDPVTGTGRYELGPQPLPDLESLVDLRGRHLEFLERPVYRVIGADADEPTIECGSIEVSGPPPTLRLAVDDGIAIARDHRTLTMLSAYHELSAVVAAAEELTGSPRAQLMDQDDPIPVLFEPTFTDDHARLDGKTNAFFEGCTMTFGLMRPSASEAVALGVNRQVLAHEFGHLLFARTFELADGRCEADRGDAGDPGFPGRLQTETAIRGLNEGFADFMAFSMLGSTSILADSFGTSEFTGERAIAPSAPEYDAFTYADVENTLEGSTCRHGFYCIGTLFARSLVEAYVAGGGEVDDADARRAIGREVFEAMPAVPGRMRELGLPDASADEIVCRVEDDGPTREVVPLFLAAFVGAMPEARRPALCDAFAHHFGDIGFPADARSECAP